MYGIFTLGNQIYGDSSKDKASYAFDSGTVSVLLDDTTQQLLPASEAGALALQTTSYIDGEIVAHVDSNLISAGRYDLKKLIRGCYGTVGAQHNAGTRFMRLDDAVFKLPYTRAVNGKTISIKLQAFNHFGKGLQDISQLLPYAYQVKGNTSQDRQQGGPTLVPLAGIAIKYPFIFTGLPKISIVILDIQPGDYYALTKVAVDSFSVRLFTSWILPSASADFLSGATCTASSTGYGTPANAVDSNMGTAWQSTLTPTPIWWQADLGAGNAKIARILTLYYGAGTTWPFDLQASNTGAFSGEQVTLLSNALPPDFGVAGIPEGGASGNITFTIDNDTAYRYYRMVWAYTGGSVVATLNEIGLSDTPQRVSRYITWSAES